MKIKKKPSDTGKNPSAAETVSTGIDYSVYNMSGKERLLYILAAAAVIYAIAYIFYHSHIICLILTPLSLLYPKIRTKQIIANRKKKLTLQFKDMLYSLSTAVGAGQSVETALGAVLKDMEHQYGDSDAFIVRELRLMIARVNMNYNIEDVFADFARRSTVEDIATFASIFEISKRSGGNMVQIIRQTVDIITEKIELQTEMDTIISGKKMEQKMLTVIPIVLVYALSAADASFMEPIFTTAGGRIVATIALIMIVIGYFWSKKITDIEI